MKSINELLAQFPDVPNIDDYSSPDEYLHDAMMTSRWFLDHADDIKACLKEAAKDWIGSGEALEVAKAHGVDVTSMALWKAAADKGHIEYRMLHARQLLYERASVVAWATKREHHKSGPKMAYGEELDD